ncbi:ammonium transporter [Gordonia jinhuaensis]|nr:ammonium transporter [Gordonia jinhuaensis]
MGVPDTGDTAWMLASSALVLCMTLPGLAFFYGGMVRSKNVLNTMMMSAVSMGTVTVLWCIYGFSEAFGNDIAGTSNGGVLGDFGQYFGLKHLFSANGAAEVPASGGTPATAATNIPLFGTIPALVFVAFQLMFAIITVALVSGAVVDRMKFSAWVVFTVVWSTVVYFPVAHWVFAFNGFTAEKGGWIANNVKAIDFAGGTAVHINAGVAGLVLALFLGKRKGWPTTPMRPHNLPFTMLGAGLLWFGWYGFNAGSALTANGTAASTFATTTIATGTAMLTWMLTEKLRDGHATSLGAASGIVAGLVAITPSCSSVNTWGALIIGALAGIVCALAVGLKFKFGYDDALDVVGVHMVGGLLGTILIGFVAVKEAPAGVDGLFFGGGADQLWRQCVGALSVLAYSGVVTAIIALILKYTTGLRADPESEAIGLDESEHAESAYDLAPIGGGSALSQTGVALGKEA